MRRSMVFSATVLGGLVAVAAPAAAAPTVPCPSATGGSVASYSGNGVEVACTPTGTPSPLPDLPFTDSGANPGTVPGGGPGSGPARGNVAGPATTPGRTLPFTGGEFVLISVVGVGAIAGGSTLVLAGRKRGQAGHGA